MNMIMKDLTPPCSVDLTPPWTPPRVIVVRPLLPVNPI